MRGISWLAENRLASQAGLCSIEWVLSSASFFHYTLASPSSSLRLLPRLLVNSILHPIFPWIVYLVMYLHVLLNVFHSTVLTAFRTTAGLRCEPDTQVTLRGELRRGNVNVCEGNTDMFFVTCWVGIPTREVPSTKSRTQIAIFDLKMVSWRNVEQGCTNPVRQVAQANTFCSDA
jgi:hypothetical protein